MLPEEPRKRVQSSKSMTLTTEGGNRLVDPLKYRLKPRKTSSDSESVDGSESDSIASDANSAISSGNESENSSERIGDREEEDLEVRVNIALPIAVKSLELNMYSRIRNFLAKVLRSKQPLFPSAH